MITSAYKWVDGLKKDQKYAYIIFEWSLNFSITCILENRPFGFQYQKLDTYIQDKLQFFCISKTKKKTKVCFIYTFLSSLSSTSSILE